jgi:hypothetical protein
MAGNKQAIHLYWAYTDDHDEDWFVFAESAKIARAFHEDYEGYNRGDARARLIVSDVHFEQLMNGTTPCHAQIPELLQLNFEIVGTDPDRRAVQLNGKVFVEGMLESLVEMARASFQAAQKAPSIQFEEASSATMKPSSGGIPASGVPKRSLKLVSGRRG